MTMNSRGVRSAEKLSSRWCDPCLSGDRPGGSQVRHFGKSPPASDISSDIATALAANGGKPRITMARARKTQVAQMETDSHQRQTVAKDGKGNHETPCLPAILQIVATNCFCSPPFAVVCRQCRAVWLRTPPAFVGVWLRGGSLNPPTCAQRDHGFDA